MLCGADNNIISKNCVASAVTTEMEESEEDSDEVEELRVNRDMESYKDAVDEAEREEGESLISLKFFFFKSHTGPGREG